MLARHTLVLLIVASGALGAQTPASVADSSRFRPLTLPPPNEYRTASGRPGPKYWQQQVDYRITATLDPANNEVRGRETIHYVNRSPDALPYLWMHVEQNICEPSSVTNVLNQPPLSFLGSTFDFSCQGFNSAPRMESLKIGGREAKRTRFGTTLRVDLERPLGPGMSLDLEAVWHFKVPAMGAARMGRDGTLYEIAQWYPRMAVYDDVRGWNHEPYIGAGEFYLEFGDFDVTLTVPAGYIVAATGELTNPGRVLTAAQRQRLERARRSDTSIAIITASEAGNARLTRPSQTGTLTWHFTAKNVRDFAFAAGPELRWDASGYDGILISALYRPKADKWPEVAKMGREAIKFFSEQWTRYPFPQATTVEGPVEGMEYPMLTFVPNSPTREDLYWVVMHEFGHQWFPMAVGSNERLYPWMDEGFNTFFDLANAAKYFSGTPYGDTIEVHPLRLYADHGLPGNEQPLINRPIEVRDLFWGGYQKPALMLQLLRFEVMGKERFDAAFREYIKTWSFKHPTPADFFRLMRDHSGMELDWFWRDWIYTTARLDQAVDSVSRGSGGITSVHLANRGTMVMPAELSVAFDDGTTTVVKLPVDMWNLGDRFVYRVPGTKAVRSVEIDPRRAMPDIDRANNRWPRGR
jgi:hypothetical protein